MSRRLELLRSVSPTPLSRGMVTGRWEWVIMEFDPATQEGDDPLLMSWKRDDEREAQALVAYRGRQYLDGLTPESEPSRATLAPFLRMADPPLKRLIDRQAVRLVRKGIAFKILGLSTDEHASILRAPVPGAPMRYVPTP